VCVCVCVCVCVFVCLSVCLFVCACVRACLRIGGLSVGMCEWHGSSRTERMGSPKQGESTKSHESFGAHNLEHAQVRNHWRSQGCCDAPQRCIPQCNVECCWMGHGTPSSLSLDPAVSDTPHSCPLRNPLSTFFSIIGVGSYPDYIW
jgi:hypothetical protein